jgi:hypothetical protein
MLCNDNALICIRKLFGSNLGRYTTSPNSGFTSISSVPPGKCRYSTSIMPRPFPSKSFPIQLSFDANKSDTDRIAKYTTIKERCFSNTY